VGNFEAWHENADIPHQQENGKWVDLETGFEYEPNIDYSDCKIKRKELSQKAKDNRTIAKMFGAKALRGTVKQKEWAEKIRAEVLKSVTEKQATLLCASQSTSHSKFWIENRNLNAKEMGDIFEKICDIAKKYNELLEDAKKHAGTSRHEEIITEIQNYKKEYEKAYSELKFA